MDTISLLFLRFVRPSLMTWFFLSPIFSWSLDLLSKNSAARCGHVTNFQPTRWKCWVVWQLSRTYLKRKCRMCHFLSFILPLSRILECSCCHLDHLRQATYCEPEDRKSQRHPHKASCSQVLGNHWQISPWVLNSKCGQQFEGQATAGPSPWADGLLSTLSQWTRQKALVPESSLGYIRPV